MDGRESSSIGRSDALLFSTCRSILQVWTKDFWAEDVSEGESFASIAAVDSELHTGCDRDQN